MNAKNNFKINFKRLRMELGMTQEKLAADLNITRPALGAYEEGRAIPRIDNLIKMAEYFKITLDQLIK